MLDSLLHQWYITWWWWGGGGGEGGYDKSGIMVVHMTDNVFSVPGVCVCVVGGGGGGEGGSKRNSINDNGTS